MINHKLIGGILLIVGTSIGGGMLALPVITAAAGLTNTVIFLLICWLIMTVGALLILEVNLRLPPGSNMVSMAKSTLGLPGQIIAWFTYLFLLYTLLAGYISGGSDVFNSLLFKAHIHLPTWVASLLFTGIFSLIIYSGIRAVDYVNRGLMFGKLGIYFILVALISPHISIDTLSGGSLEAITGSSLIPLVCYILWEAVIMGVIERDGSNGLVVLKSSEHAISGLTNALSNAVHSQWITGFFGFFTSICMITAFLGVSLGLFDFLSDGLNMKKSGQQGKWVLALTFLPPLLVVLTYPGIYIQAFNYAGICCVILLLLLPAAMAWQGRKADTCDSVILVGGGNVGLGIISVIGVFLLGLASGLI